MKKILTIGGATQDIFIKYEDPQIMQILSSAKNESFTLLQEGKKIDVEEIHYSSGGGATNTAVGFCRLGLDAKPFFKIGNDEAGNFILKELKKFNLSTEYAIISEYKTAISFIIPSLKNNYSALCFRGANKHLEQKDLSDGIIKTVDYIYITSLPGESAKNLPDFAKNAKKYNIKVAVNPGSMQLINYGQTIYETLRNIDVLILNAFEAEKCLHSLLNISSENYQFKQKTISKPCPELLNFFTFYQKKPLTLHNFFETLLELGPQIIVVTNGAEGVYIGTKDSLLFHPSLKTEVISTIGAGDAFGSAFIGSLALGKPIEEAMVSGIINSTSVISHLDTKQGLLTIKELEDKYQDIKTNELKIYS